MAVPRRLGPLTIDPVSPIGAYRLLPGLEKPTRKADLLTLRHTAGASQPADSLLIASFGYFGASMWPPTIERRLTACGQLDGGKPRLFLVKGVLTGAEAAAYIGPHEGGAAAGGTGIHPRFSRSQIVRKFASANLFSARPLGESRNGQTMGFPRRVL